MTGRTAQLVQPGTVRGAELDDYQKDFQLQDMGPRLRFKKSK